MDFLYQYGLFLAQTLTWVVAILVIVVGIVSITSKDKGGPSGKLSVVPLNEKYRRLANAIRAKVMPKKAFKSYLKTLKKSDKKDKNVYVLDFQGDIRAKAVDALREEISAVLQIAEPKDEVVIRLESPGGMVNAYGLAASQLQRIKDKQIPLTICIDKVAASGGYLMACVASQIVAAPFALIGSIGVVAQIPNFNRLLKKNDIDFEVLTAGEYKRTLTLFGENTDKAREKFKADLEQIHYLFKDFVSMNREALDIEQVATGEHWLAKQAQELALVDTLQTSDDYLLSACEQANIYQISYKKPKKLAEKISESMQANISNILSAFHLT